MDPFTLVTAGMALLNPLLAKAGEKAFETIGEKLAEKSLEKSFWQTIKSVFIRNDEQAFIEAIEQKPIAAPQEVAMIEQKIKTAVSADPQFAAKVKGVLKITPLNEFLIDQKVQSIDRLQKEIINLEVQMERAGIATVGDYQNVIDSKHSKLEYQVNELSKLLNG